MGVTDSHKPSCFQHTDTLAYRSRGQKSHLSVTDSNKVSLWDTVQKNPHACFCPIQRPPALPDSKLPPAPSKTAAQNHLRLICPGYVNSLQLRESLGSHQLHLETSLNHTCSLFRYTKRHIFSDAKYQDGAFGGLCGIRAHPTWLSSGPSLSLLSRGAQASLLAPLPTLA